MTPQGCLEMNSSKRNKIHLEAGLTKALEDFPALRDFTISLDRGNKDQEILLEIYLKSLRSFLEGSKEEQGDQEELRHK